MLVLLGLVGASAPMSALGPPGAPVAPFLEPLAACGARAVLPVLGPQAQLLRFWLLLATAVAVVLGLLTALSDPALFADKMPAGAAPLVRRLGAGAGAPRAVPPPHSAGQSQTATCSRAWWQVAERR